MEYKKYSCLVVDDEPIARKIIIKYIEQAGFLSLSAACINAPAAIDHLKKHAADTDIIFLDINMPNLSGIQLFEITQPAQPVIFTTAYAEYAVQSYELNAVDYLLKPFSAERFITAAAKAVNRINNTGTDTAEKKQLIFIKSDGRNHPVYTDDILYCEAMRNYTLVKLKGERKLMPLMPLSGLENLLSELNDDFVRVHRSFIVSKKAVTAVTPHHVIMGKFEIPLSMSFRDRFYYSFRNKF